MKQSHVRIQGHITKGKGVSMGAIEAHEKNVMAISRRIVTLERSVTDLNKRLKAAKQELKAKRRELRAVLQRDSSITDEQLDRAGKADAIDAIDHAGKK